MRERKRQGQRERESLCVCDRKGASFFSSFVWLSYFHSFNTPGAMMNFPTICLLPSGFPFISFFLSFVVSEKL